MPHDLLQELQTAAPVAVSLENVEDLVRVLARDVGCAAEGMKGSARAFENGWRRIVIEVAKGQTAQMHAVRSRLLSAFEERLRLLKETEVLANWLRKLGRTDVVDPAILLPEIAGMEQLKSQVFDRWQTAEDLEDLAARDYPLTTAELDQVGSQRRPPASFYAAESKPF